MMKRVVAGVVVLAGGLATAGIAAATATTDPAPERNAEASFTAAHRGDAAVRQADAERAATERHAGTIVDTHLEDEGHGLRWEVKPNDGSKVWEVQIDATSGKVVSDHGDE